MLCIDQAERWRRGQRHRAEDYLFRHPTVAADEEAAIDLIYSEFVVRQQGGENPMAEEYAGRFPGYAERLRRLLNLDQLLLGDPQAPDPRAARLTSVRLAAGPSPDVPLDAPAQIGKYRVIHFLGEGGQAQVYRAVHPALEQDVVIKWSRRAAGPDQREPLLAEGKVLAGLSHPNLARVLDLDFHDDRAFLVMEYSPGVSLEQQAATGRFSPGRRRC